MRKILFMLLTFVMTLSLFSCGLSTEEIDNEIQGSWTGNDDGYVFDLGEVGYTTGYEAKMGTYYIEEDEIICNFDDGSCDELPYTVENGQVTIIGYEKLN